MNGIVCVNNNNISFNSRLLRIQHPENFPKDVLYAVNTNSSINRFIREGQPRTLFGKIKDWFKKDEYLDIDYHILSGPDINEEVLSFQFGIMSIDNHLLCTHSLDIIATQKGTIKQHGRKEIHKQKYYLKTGAHRIINALDKIIDFNKRLTGKSYPQYIKV